MYGENATVVAAAMDRESATGVAAVVDREGPRAECGLGTPQKMAY